MESITYNSHDRNAKEYEAESNCVRFKVESATDDDENEEEVERTFMINVSHDGTSWIAKIEERRAVFAKLFEYLVIFVSVEVVGREVD